MNFKYLAIGTIAAGLVLFAWGALSHTVIPWHKKTVEVFETPEQDDAIVETIRSQTGGNGVFFSKHGILMVVAFNENYSDKTKDISRNLGIQAGIDFTVALLLALLVMRLPAGSALTQGFWLALAALAAGTAKHLSELNWYGFTPAYAAVNIADLVIGWFLVGLVLGLVRNKTA